MQEQWSRQQAAVGGCLRSLSFASVWVVGAGSAPRTKQQRRGRLGLWLGTAVLYQCLSQDWQQGWIGGGSGAARRKTLELAGEAGRRRDCWADRAGFQLGAARCFAACAC